MARCSTCSAPLKANSNQCSYCQVRSDVDLRAKYDYTVVDKHSKRICPDCNCELTTINLETVKSDKGKNLQIDRCDSCFGLFFDPGEVEELLEKSVSNVFTINKKHMQNINRDRFKKDNNIKYRKCPICQSFMQRSNYGHRSGVIVDRCHKHGVWLDSGEITHLMEWKKSGGQMLNEQIKNEQMSKEKSKRFNSSPDMSQYKSQTNSNHSFNTGDDIVDTVFSLLNRLF